FWSSVRLAAAFCVGIVLQEWIDHFFGEIQAVRLNQEIGIILAVSIGAFRKREDFLPQLERFGTIRFSREARRATQAPITVGIELQGNAILDCGLIPFIFGSKCIASCCKTIGSLGFEPAVGNASRNDQYQHAESEPNPESAALP